MTASSQFFNWDLRDGSTLINNLQRHSGGDQWSRRINVWVHNYFHRLIKREKIFLILQGGILVGAPYRSGNGFLREREQKASSCPIVPHRWSNEEEDDDTTLESLPIYPFTVSMEDGSKRDAPIAAPTRRRSRHRWNDHFIRGTTFSLKFSLGTPRSEYLHMSHIRGGLLRRSVSLLQT